MPIELLEFDRRLQRKIQKHDDSLKDLYRRTCEKDGVEADAATGRCRVCRRQIFQVEHDPVPAGVLRRVDPAKAELQRQFYARLARQTAEREQAAAEAGRKKYVTLLPSESLSGDPPKRDWSRIVDQHGHLRHLS